MWLEPPLEHYKGCKARCIEVENSSPSLSKSPQLALKETCQKREAEKRRWFGSMALGLAYRGTYSKRIIIRNTTKLHHLIATGIFGDCMAERKHMKNVLKNKIKVIFET